jgi:phage tail sheath protein FI
VPRYALRTFAVKAPATQAKLCTNFSEFQARFGRWSAYPAASASLGDSAAIEPNGHQILSHAVFGFFNNGGKRAFVARVRKDNLADDLQQALETMESVEAISLVAFPGYSSDPKISSALVAHCEKTKYRFAILDAPSAPVDAQGALDLQQLTYDSAKPALPFRTKHAAVYFPYIEVVDPALQLQQANLEAIPSKYKGLVCVPPSGAIAGIYARTDVQRGVFKAPANASVLGAQNVKYYVSRNAQEGLNPQGVNCIRTLNGDITVWGARTCGGDENGEWRYINVRRTYLYIAKSIDEGTQWVVFEPNDATLWGKVRRNITAFLTTVWRDGALFGATAEEAFYVKCDAENNPPETREVGRLVVEVGVSIVKPAEFVIIRITQGSRNPAA